ncbi:MAG: hypothetical protein A2942_04830 [Candidatus Lloydbacteria bacterium RIFCSPLOWO2_01_FULL_50_20]|uniref:DUF5652 domain-containing protein n=1 Tax=Candidatus Lloydbacteria bacterium RIFCSPLOWO2_01_FULL_50_20 TaxID=1798665 RepID=A0A1G2DDI2_9BACT|nr:MAG: hypothetical protein A3C13_02305 [Candidatus Lloydbacteria bacterium RIFCSPHIGHO2_02_FULL_50_11]OGZ11694.1 MAG: hypothetical protein A2942_04830 [Candidatus Lloydbacteria bacterium RIFCSPLOWO2_01_FULL_50_20]
MMTISIVEIAKQFGVPTLLLVSLFVVLLVWSLFWKGWALWISARKTEKTWFVIFLLVNTVGILEIVYLFLLNKKEPSIGEPN